MPGRPLIVLLVLSLLFAGCRGLGNRSAPPSGAPGLAADEIRRADAWSHYVLAFLAEADRRPQAAVEYFQRAADGDPDYLPLALQLAALHVMEQRFDRALPLLERAVRQKPPPLPALILLGHVHLASDRPDQAIRTFRRVIREAPHRSEGYIKAAAIELDRQRLPAAFALLDAGLDKVHDPIPLLQVYEALGKSLLANRRRC